MSARSANSSFVQHAASVALGSEEAIAAERSNDRCADSAVVRIGSLVTVALLGVPSGGQTINAIQKGSDRGKPE